MRQELSIVCWACFHKKGVSAQPCMGVLNSVALSLQLMMVSAPSQRKKGKKKLTSKDTHQQDEVDVEQCLTSACIYYVPLQQLPPAGKQRKGIQEQI